MKKQVLALSESPVFERFVTLLDWLEHEPANLLRVLTYHRVDEPLARPNLSPVLLSATPQTFAQQMALVKEHYNPVSIEQVLAYYDVGQALPKKAVLVTFDDAYCDFAEHAWPVLKRLDIPVTLFVPTAFPDQVQRQLWWDQLYNALRHTELVSVESAIGRLSLENDLQRSKAFKRLRAYVKELPHLEAMEWVKTFCERLAIPALLQNEILSWEALRKLAQEGVKMAAHTQTHPMMNRITPEEARQEVSQSRADLETQIGASLPVFAYPSGQLSDAVVQVLKEEGFQLAFTTERGINQLATANPLLLKRINVGQSTNLPLMRAQFLALTRYIR